MRLSYLSLALSSLVAACGGGGGGGSPAPVVQVPGATLVALNSTNYVTATTEAVAPTLDALDAPSTVVGIESAGGNEGVKFALAQVPTLGKWFGSQTAVGVIQTRTINCSTSGTISAVANDADNNGVISAGDSLTVTASNCNDGGSTTINGSIGVSVITLTGNLDSDNYNAALRLTFSNLSAASPGRTANLNGDLSLSASATGIYRRNQSITASSLLLDANIGGTTNNRGVTNFAATYSEVPNSPTSAFRTALTVSGTVSSSALNNGFVNIATNSPFVRLSTNPYPSSGQGVITGANASQVRLTAQSATTVLIELDAAGDGVYETSTTRQWSEIR